MDIKSGNGVSGMLVQSHLHMGDESWYFRICAPDNPRDFIDYKLTHPDLRITIDDKSAVLKDGGYGNRFLDLELSGMDKAKIIRRLKGST